MQHPGLAKAKPPNIIESMTLALIRPNDKRVAQLISGADVISEGRVRDDGEGRVWFGSTSLIVQPTEDAQVLVTLLSRDLHARTRIIRVAQREASIRAPRPLGALSCEVTMTVELKRLRIDVDVQAPLIESRSRGHHIA